MEKVSIIVPVYNAEPYISKCLESLIGQTYENIEIIIINDGSTDNSYKICKSYADKDDRIILVNIENSGVSTARNNGIKKATGDYITFVDSDDWVESNMVEFALMKAKENSADVVMWSYYRHIGDKEYPSPLLYSYDKTFINEKDILYLKSIDSAYNQEPTKHTVSAGTTWCKLYKTDLINSNKLKFNSVLTRAQDTVFSINAFYHAERIVYYNEPLYHYEINDTSISAGKKYLKDTKTPFNELLREFYNFAEKIGESDELKKTLYIRTIKVLNWHLEHKYFHEEYTKGILNRRKNIINIINSHPYRLAIKNVEINKLPKKEKLMTQLFRKKLILFYYLVYRLYKKVAN